MTNVVVAMEAAGRTRQGTFAPAQPCATRDSAQIKFTEHVGQGAFALSAICAGDGACVRAAGILGSLETETVAPQIQRPAPNFKSALATPFADTGGLRGFLPSFRLRFNSFRPLAGWSFHALLQFLQEPTSRVVKRFQVVRSLLCAAAHVEQQTTGSKACRTQTKGIRNP